MSMDQAPAQVVEIVANLDDCTGQEIGLAVQTLLDDGALDVWTTPIAMKKDRPGVMLSLLCHPEQRQQFARRVIALTGTFGVRWRPWDRIVLHRHHERLHTPYGEIRIKVGTLDGQRIVARPEFEDVKRAATEHGVSVREVLDALPPGGER